MDCSGYSPAVRELLAIERLNELGPGRPVEELHGQLAALTVESLFAPARIQQRESAECCLAALWLYHDFFDESHNLSQSIATTAGSYWHGILHRREPDYANAAYWFRKVGGHPIFEGLSRAAVELAAASSAEIAVPVPWDPFWFIDLCEKCANTRGPVEQFARLVQKAEWELLFDFCYARALEVF